MCVENDTLKGEKYTGTALDLMAAVQTTIDGTQGARESRREYDTCSDTLGSGRCLESSSCILFTSFSRPLSLYVQGTSNPFPSFLLPVTTHDTWPPCIKKCHIVFACSQGTCPTITSSFLTHTACLSWSLRGSGNTIRISPKLGVQIVL